MKPLIAKQMKSLNIVIYAQSGILAGDLAALLSGHNTVDRQTSLPGVINSLKSQTDVLLLVGGKGNLPDPLPVLLMAKKIHCKVIMLGDWSDSRDSQSDNKIYDSVTTLAEIPAPAVLFKLIASSKTASG